ncbi:cell division protein FtsQ/DivIB [Roseovarius sp. LXJ103]|uniref:cell division protein FtsQ/DivIB n=1 Tax=Roseovarius carneus TaxID=2853164 RepID=UPI000D61D8CD|nr:cell division protein FtsQ/DivIB [Roseovarius carneus]MBZ8118872.1 cell division protein FtsQ/DivIB [Roseovarius carneus]PWE35466.1 cell division protein FtsQ [Pelagicola sp. LXJ1103]
MSEMNTRCDPAPSRWSYRYQRVMLTPLYRRLLCVGIPFCLTFGVATAYLSDEKVQQSLLLGYLDLRQQVQSRPEFMVKLLAVEGASEVVADDIRVTFPYALPLSSFDMDLDAVRAAVEEIPAVKTAAVRLRQGGVLDVQVTEREPAALLRTTSGLMVVDAEGLVIDIAQMRGDHPGLPVLTGDAAERSVPEALEIRTAAGPLTNRMRGLVRMNARRWDVVLEGDVRIMLPEVGPVRALERVIVLDQAQDILERDIVVVDMRLPERPTLRMKERAVEDWWRVRDLSVGIAEQ